MAQTRASKMTSKFLLLSNLHSLLSPDLNVKCNALFVLQKDVEMVIKNNAFVRLPVSEAAKTPWDIFAAEPRMQCGVSLIHPSKEF